MRWTDFIGVLGLAMWVTGLLLLFPKSLDEVNWISRSGGAALALVGLVAIVGSILVRFSKPQSYRKSR